MPRRTTPMSDFLQAITQKATEITQQTGGGMPSPMQSMPNPSQADVSQFEDAMQVNGTAPTQGAQPAQPTDTSLTTAPAVEHTTPPNSGDAILNGLQKMTENYSANVAQVQSGIDATALNPGDTAAMMRLQFDLSTMMLQQDLTAKVADRANQGVQTLFKNQ
ncbi:hypothetical protein DB346_23480 [Verrucomicrobia bacterium LW23]|nr:hypothetical protein DB346_23480 [Verrucomicrobia bacterium LW23]